MNNAKEKVKKPIPHKKIIVAVIMIVTAFFGSFLVYFILQVSLNTEAPIVVVISESMEPNILKGDLLFVRGTDPNYIYNGDVIVFDARGLWFNAPQEPIVHRVINKYNISNTWYFTTQGDNNALPDDEDIPESRVIGVVVGRIPYIGWVKIFLTESGLLIPLLVIISALLIISIIRDIIKGDDEDQDKKNRESLKEIGKQSKSED